ncbi:hypothetical protein O181_039969 [Austropuccinia psidii MF-1]|uniref:Uncharacterized protein n=1 Tax=Austropuccinia psidii MF-1 TaxID=1389203 RepID=A0A9Q3DBB8_9BASI|nr:hypothetical protein [Austropuccinia psidii MF-1]
MKARILKELQEKVSSYPSSIRIRIQGEKIAVKISTRLEFITSFPTKPWRKLLLIKNMEIIKEEAIDKVKQLVRDRKPQDVQIFMDGSNILDKGKGAEAVIMPSGLTVARKITETTLATNFELELVEIKLAIELIRRELYSKGKDKNQWKKYIFSVTTRGVTMLSSRPQERELFPKRLLNQLKDRLILEICRSHSTM